MACRCPCDGLRNMDLSKRKFLDDAFFRRLFMRTVPHISGYTNRAPEVLKPPGSIRVRELSHVLIHVSRREDYISLGIQVDRYYLHCTLKSVNISSLDDLDL